MSSVVWMPFPGMLRSLTCSNNACSWASWETIKTMVPVKKGEKLVARKARIEKTGMLEELLLQLKEELKPLAETCVPEGVANSSSFRS